MDRPWLSAELTTKITGSQSSRFPCVGFQEESTVYERKVGTRDEILQLIFDAANRVDETTVRNVSLSIVEQVRLCIQADGGRFEHLLH
jgi:hypothetical protein